MRVDPFSSEGLQLLNELDDWVTKAASAGISPRFLSEILDHIGGISFFRGGQNWEAWFAEELGDRGTGPMTRSCVANVWQEDQRPPSGINARQRVRAGQEHHAANDQPQPLSVPGFPWYY